MKNERYEALAECVRCKQQKSATTSEWRGRKGLCQKCFYAIPCRQCGKDVAYESRRRWKRARGKYANAKCGGPIHDECRQQEKISKSTGFMSRQEEMLYIAWQQAVKSRDKARCKSCDTVETTDDRLHAHHVMPVKRHPFLSLVIDNGITLCKACHQSKTGVHGTSEPLNELIASLRKRLSE